MLQEARPPAGQLVYYWRFPVTRERRRRPQWQVGPDVRKIKRSAVEIVGPAVPHGTAPAKANRKGASVECSGAVERQGFRIRPFGFCGCRSGLFLADVPAARPELTA